MRYSKFLLYGFFLFLPGCKKGTTSISNSYYLTASINAVESEFNVDLHAFISPLDTTSASRCSFIGYQQKNQDSAVLEFSFISYTHENVTSNTTYPGGHTSLLIAYNKKPSGHIYYNDQYGTNFTVVIDDITSAYISGSFYGIMMDERIPADTIILSNGKFKVPIKQ